MQKKFLAVLPPGTKASGLLSQKANPGSKTGTNGPVEPGQKTVFVVVTRTKRSAYEVLINLFPSLGRMSLGNTLSSTPSEVS